LPEVGVWLAETEAYLVTERGTSPVAGRRWWPSPPRFRWPGWFGILAVWHARPGVFPVARKANRLLVLWHSRLHLLALWHSGTGGFWPCVPRGQ